VANRLPFGAFDEQVLQGLRAGGTAYQQAAAPHVHHAQGAPAAAAREPLPSLAGADPKACRNWNLFSCRDDKCSRQTLAQRNLDEITKLG